MIMINKIEKIKNFKNFIFFEINKNIAQIIKIRN
jgi:hypothetical protein